MAEQNRHIEEYLNEYRKMKDVDFAVMITGPWGCGKTHFIEEYLKEHCTPKNEERYLYISLNGVADIADIDMALFQASHPILGSNLAVIAGRIFKASVRATCKIDLDINSDGVADGSVGVDPLAGISLAKFKLSTKGKLLVFDDLERCLLKPEEVLGYINAFVEKKEAKVLIIGDEKHFGIDDPPCAYRKEDTSKKTDGADNHQGTTKYWMIKEKVIGKTFRLTERVEEIFGDLISDSTFPKTYEVIDRNKDMVVSMFKIISEKTEKYNYRALRHCFRDFESFYRIVDEDFRKNEDFVNHIFKLFLVLDYELQLANISPSDFKKEDPQVVLAREMDLKNTEKSEPTTKLAAVFSRHLIEYEPFLSLSDMCFPVKLWKKILTNERVEKTEINGVIQNSPFFPKEQPAWIRLRYWDQLEDDEFSRFLEEVRGGIRKFEYRSPGVITHVFSILAELVNRGAIEELEGAVLDDAKEYIDKLVENGSLKISELEHERFDWVDFGSSGLGYHRRDSDFFRDLVDHLKNAVVKANENKIRVSVQGWMKQLEDDPETFFKSIIGQGEYAFVPVLQYFDPSEFLKIVLQMPNEKKWIVGSALKHRYERTGELASGLIQELPFLQRLLEQIKNQLEQHTGWVKPSIANLKDWENVIGKSINLLEDIEKQGGLAGNNGAES